jgi:hypothetical protein
MPPQPDPEQRRRFDLARSLVADDRWRARFRAEYRVARPTDHPRFQQPDAFEALIARYSDDGATHNPAWAGAWIRSRGFDPDVESFETAALSRAINEELANRLNAQRVFRLTSRTIDADMLATYFGTPDRVARHLPTGAARAIERMLERFLHEQFSTLSEQERQQLASEPAIDPGPTIDPEPDTPATPTPVRPPTRAGRAALRRYDAITGRRSKPESHLARQRESSEARGW